MKALLFSNPRLTIYYSRKGFEFVHADLENFNYAKEIENLQTRVGKYSKLNTNYKITIENNHKAITTKKHKTYFSYVLMALMAAGFVSVAVFHLIYFAIAPIGIENGVWPLYSVATYMFAHSTFMHFISNVFIVAIIGLKLEEVFGCFKLILAFIITWIITTAAIWYFSYDVITLGMSGFGFSIMAIMLLIGYENPFVFKDLSFHKSLFILFILNVLTTFLFSSHISVAGHFSGLLAGIICYFLIFRRGI